MKILFILPQIPYPPHSGGRIVTWNTVKRFARDWDVSVVCLYHHPSELEGLEAVKEICSECAAFPAHGKWSVAPMLRSFFSRWPYKAHRFYNPAMHAYIHRLHRRERFDVIHAQNFYTTAYVSGQEECLKIHYKENIEGHILRRFAGASRNPLIKLAAWLEGQRTLAFERRACQKFDQILTISPLDGQWLSERLPRVQIAHQRPGVDMACYPYLPEAEEPPTVVFTGTMSYYPNADGVLWYLRDIWPRVKDQVNNAQCYLVGAHPSPAIQAYDGKQDVHITGRVPDVHDYLKKAWVYVVPLRIGGGIRLKILEAMASGRAIVSTAVGCEGLDVHPGRDLLQEDAPNAFADAVIALLQNHAKRDSIRKNARALAEAHYDWDRVIPSQQSLYCSLSKQRPSPS